METLRPPYIVKNHKGTPEIEVPWRDGARTRTARRNELIMILQPQSELPAIELCSLAVLIGGIKAELYFTVFVNTHTVVTIPFHKSLCVLKSAKSAETIDLTQLILSQVSGRHKGLIATETEVSTNGLPTMFQLNMHSQGIQKTITLTPNSFELRLKISGTDIPVIQSGPLERVSANDRKGMNFYYWPGGIDAPLTI